MTSRGKRTRKGIESLEKFLDSAGGSFKRECPDSRITRSGDSVDLEASLANLHLKRSRSGFRGDELELVEGFAKRCKIEEECGAGGSGWNRWNSTRSEQNERNFLALGKDIWALIMSFIWMEYDVLSLVCKLFSSQEVQQRISILAQLVPRYPLQNMEYSTHDSEMSIENNCRAGFYSNAISSDPSCADCRIPDCVSLVQKRFLCYAIHLGLVGVIKAIGVKKRSAESVALAKSAIIENQTDVLRFALQDLLVEADELFQLESFYSPEIRAVLKEFSPHYS